MRFTFLIIGVVVVAACSPRYAIVKELKATELELKDHAGFALYDPERKKFLIEYQSDRYFTPASNTKIFTFYSSLKLLGDSTITFKFIQQNDSLIFWGMGDPSFLNPDTFSNGKPLEFLQSQPGKLFFSSSNFQTESLGPGWAWDDYSYSYSAERSPMPLYGNLISIKKDSSMFKIEPPRFFEHFTEATLSREYEEVIRELDNNQLTYYPGKSNGSEWKVPVRYSSDLMVDLLSDTLKRMVEEINWLLPEDAKEVQGVPLDSVYRVMMQDSDNFIAEQLLLQCSGMVSDTLKPEIAIDYVVKHYLSDLPDEPRWVDGSGLSRYNLFTPRSIVMLWNKIQSEVPQERLFKLLAVGGRNGTIKDWYRNEVPYIFGKTGTLSNNHALSGYLVTRKGKILIFSMMNNNYLATTTEVRKRMEKVLYTIHEKF
jgi:serine-type D-Ala-D-Ala carboxypeptidase/endopeptidase (penicillin-binding protein 4)